MKKECDGMEERVILLIDGELDGQEAHATLEHVAECGDCKKLFDEHKRITLAAETLFARKEKLPRICFEEEPFFATLLNPISTFFRNLIGARLSRLAVGAAAILIIAVLAFELNTFKIESPVATPDTATIVVGRLEGSPVSLTTRDGKLVNIGREGEIAAGSTIATGNGEARLATDRYNVNISSRTIAMVTKDGVKLERGRIFIDYFKKPGHYTIDTPNARIEIVGTKLSVSFDGVKTEVAVTEGKVKVEKNNGEIYLLAGEKALVEKYFEPVKVAPNEKTVVNGPVTIPAETNISRETGEVADKARVENIQGAQSIENTRRVTGTKNTGNTTGSESTETEIGKTSSNNGTVGITIEKKLDLTPAEGGNTTESNVNRLIFGK